MWVLDTNTLIYFFKGEGRVAGELLARAPRDIGIPSVVLYELQVGIAKSSCGAYLCGSGIAFPSKGGTGCC